jgi:hypothetical protein
MWTRLKRTLAYVALAVALFACVWTSRVFVSPRLVTLLLPMTGLLAVALVAVFGGLLPALPFGVGYGLLAPRPLAWKAFRIALGACVFELALASASVRWWSFFTWWVLPLECVTLMLCFPAAAWAVGRLRGADALRRTSE